ncbi:MAG: ABC transporter ATP-binding protein [Thermotogaceae bacterium]|nr:ABC transporter ATP-binding protein [Thermotogaceae bacterium]
MKKAIEVRKLKKYFKNVRAVDGITFDVDWGEFFALLGPNGAGKSTTIRMLTTLAVPTSGQAFVAGYDVVKEEKEVRKRIGLVSDRLILYDRLTVLENIVFFSSFYNISKSEIYKRAQDLLELLDMWDWRNTRVSKLSTGMRQKVNIARALVPQPDILFLDEPTLGLDPHTTKKIREFIKDLNNKGKTIILTTHILHEVELLADRVAIMNKGKIVALDTTRNLKKFFKEKEIVEVEYEGNLTDLCCVSVIESVDGYIKVEVQNLNKFLNDLSQKNVKILSLKTYEPSLEDIFVSLTGGEEK